MSFYTALAWIPAGVTPRNIPKQTQLLEQMMEKDLPEDEAAIESKYDLGDSNNEDENLKTYNDTVFNDQYIQRNDNEDEDSLVEESDLFLACADDNGRLNIYLYQYENENIYEHRFYEVSIGGDKGLITSMSWLLGNPGNKGESSYLALSFIDNGMIEFWNMNVAESVQPDCHIEAHEGSISSVNWNMVVGNQLLSTSPDRTAKIWDINSLELIKDFRFDYEVHCSDWNFGSKGTNFAVGTTQGCYVCDVNSGSVQAVLCGDQPIGCTQFLNDGNNILICTDNQDPLPTTILLYDIRNPDNILSKFEYREEGNITKLSASRFPDKQIFSSVDDAGSYALYSIDENSQIQPFRKHKLTDGLCFSCAFSPDNPFLIGVAHGEVNIIDTEEEIKKHLGINTENIE